MDHQEIMRQERPMQHTVIAPVPKREDTPETKRMKEGFSFFGPATFCYALFYTFCMFKNGSGITFPFFIAASLLYLCFSLSKLELILKKGSAFYMVSMMLLAVSTFCTDDWRIIAFNKTGIFLLMMSLLLHQFYDTANWKLGKYFGKIFIMVFACLGEIGRPFTDAARYFKHQGGRKNKNLWYVLLGIVIALPLLLIVTALLSSADAVFREVADRMLQGFRIGNIFNILFRVVFMFFASYLLTAFLCKRTLNGTVKDHRKGEPVLAITVNGLLTLIYLLFSGIQIVYLFLGKMQLPQGYTYAAYAREGFFQLLAVGILNLIIVLMSLSLFRESRVLKGILTVMSLCTFVMIASSALRIMIYIRFYYLTFLRILVLWGLLLLFALFIGIVVSIFRESFPLFRYGTVVVTVLYLLLSFAHPDYIIAAVNVANAPAGLQEQENNKWEPQNSFFLSDEPYHDYGYLAGLSADAAPVLIPYLAELGYDLDIFYKEGDPADQRDVHKWQAEGFGYYYLRRLKRSTDSFSIRTYNISRHMALKQIEAGGGHKAK